VVWGCWTAGDVDRGCRRGGGSWVWGCRGDEGGGVFVWGGERGGGSGGDGGRGESRLEWVEGMR